MKRQISFQQYRSIDLTLFAAMAVVFEWIIVTVSNMPVFVDEAYTVSLAGALVSIIYMRWGFWGGIHAALMGAIYCFYSKGAANQYIIYIVGNLCSLPMVLVLKLLGHERVRNSKVYLLFPLGVIGLMLAGRAAVAMVQGVDFQTALMFVTTDSLSVLFTLVIVWISKRLDGMFEEQRHYLLRVQEEQERERAKQEREDPLEM